MRQTFGTLTKLQSGIHKSGASIRLTQSPTRIKYEDH
jgi:hypothetical protein